MIRDEDDRCVSGSIRDEDEDDRSTISIFGPGTYPWRTPPYPWRTQIYQTYQTPFGRTRYACSRTGTRTRYSYANISGVPVLHRYHPYHPPPSSHDLLLNPGLAPKFRCSSQPFQLAERNANYYCHSKLLGVCSLTFERPSINSGEAVTDLFLIDPKTSNWERNSENFVKRPTVFVVSDGLVVQPSVSTTSSISYLKGLDVPIEDIEEHVIKINKQEALNLLKAALITTSALTNALNLPSSRKTKQEL